MASVTNNTFHVLRFRSIDGICNNLYHPEQGSAFTTHRRLVDNTYENNANLPRGGKQGLVFTKHFKDNLKTNLNPDTNVC